MKILLAIDGSACTKRMLAYIAAHDELVGRDNTFTALHVVAPLPQHVTGFLPPATVDGYYKEQAELVFKPVEAFVAQQGWCFEPRFEVGHAADVIAARANEGKYDLLLMGTHGHTPLTGMVLGSVATRVVAQTQVPVLLVR